MSTVRTRCRLLRFLDHWRSLPLEFCRRADVNHAEILWHNVYENKPTICVECGQVFALKKLDVLEQEEEAHPVH